MLKRKEPTIQPLATEPIISGENDFKKFIQLDFPEGSFRTIQTIFIPEDEWDTLIKINHNLTTIETTKEI